jgi:hypothetical protein
MGIAAVLNDSGWMTFKKSSTILPYRPVPGLSLRDVNLIRVKEKQKKEI